MTKKNNKPKRTMAQIIDEQAQREKLQHLQRDIEIDENEVDYKQFYEDVKKQQSRVAEKFLCLNFGLITTKVEYNFEYIQNNRQNKENLDFYRRFCKVISDISTKKVKDLCDRPFNDKFTYKSYVKFYSHPSQELTDETELISIKLGGNKNQRMICWHKDPNENVLYVLGFQFTFNKSLYSHGN